MALHTPASDGGRLLPDAGGILNVLQFFIDTDSYQAGDDEAFLAEGHFDSSLIDELYEESQAAS